MKESYEKARQEIAKLMFVEDFIRDFMATERFRDPLYRVGVLNYQIGDINRIIVYQMAYPERAKMLKEELRIAVADAFTQLLCVCASTGVEFYDAALLGMEKLANREWTKKSLAPKVTPITISVREGEDVDDNARR